MNYVVLAIKGFCMGVANIIPGVSGGTMAFILGIYEDLIQSIRSVDLKFFKLLCSFKIKEAFDYVSWRFLGAVVLGALTAVFTLSKILSWLLHNEPVFVFSFFFGLIIASVVIMGRSLKKWTMQMKIGLVFSSLGAYFLVGMVPVSTPNAWWFLFLSGAIAICAMILPGISGAFILLLIGKYHYVLEAVNNRDFFVLSIFTLGAGVGIMVFARFLNWLFKKYHNLTIVVLIGLMIGSLRKIWPWKEILQAITDSRGKVIPVVEMNILPKYFDIESIFALALAIIGFFVAFGMEYYSKKSKYK